MKLQKKEEDSEKKEIQLLRNQLSGVDHQDDDHFHDGGDDAELFKRMRGEIARNELRSESSSLE